MTTVPPEAPARPRYRVTVIEWLTHDTVIEAADEDEAKAKAEQMWNADGAEGFNFRDSGIDGFDVTQL